MTSNGQHTGRPLRASDPRALGGYRIVSRLGRGGMGTVYLAEDASDRPVAVKLIHPDLAEDETFRRRFAREVESARRVARFSTAGVIDARLDEEPLFIVSEYVPGPNLHEAVRRSGPMSGGTLDSLAMGVAAALTAIHGSGVVHRDLKPANVLLSPVGPKVIDFGIARALDGSDGAATRSSQLIGTPSYMAPELILGEQPTAAADVFAWGCLVAFAGTGAAPFDAPTVPAVLHNISSAEPRLEGLDPGLHDLVSAALAKDPAARPTSPQLLARLTGQEEPAPSEVDRTIVRGWDPPGGSPVAGAPPESAPVPGHRPADREAPPPSDTRLQPPAPAAPPAPAGAHGQRPHGGAPGGHGQTAPPPYPAPGHPSPPYGQPAFGPPSGPGAPLPPAEPRKRGRAVVIGAAAVAAVLAVGTGVVALMNGGRPVPDSVPLYETDFNVDQEWQNDGYSPGESDGYWPEKRGFLLRLEPDDETSRGIPAPVEPPEGMPDGVVVSATGYAVEGPGEAVFGVRCWDSENDGTRTQYEALLRHDGLRAEIRRMNEDQGDRTLAQTTEVDGFSPYPLYDEEARTDDYDPQRPYRFDAEAVPTNTVTFSCHHRAAEDGAGERMELSMWVNGEHVLEVVDEDPLPDPPEDEDDRRRVGIVTRTGSGPEPVAVLYTHFGVAEITEES